MLSNYWDVGAVTVSCWCIHDSHHGSDYFSVVSVTHGHTGNQICPTPTPTATPVSGLQQQF